jgi:predicted membrane GTPase involved in stress response
MTFIVNDGPLAGTEGDKVRAASSATACSRKPKATSR